MFQRSADRRIVYRGAGPARLWRSLLCVGALIALLPGGGCSTSYKLGAMFQAQDDKAKTGSILAVGQDGAGMPPASDLAYAKVAAAEVLKRGGKDASQTWENPSSGARGTVTPIATSYLMEGALCRDFLASYVAEGAQSWLQGEACEQGKGKWEVRRLKPWRRT